MNVPRVSYDNDDSSDPTHEPSYRLRPRANTCHEDERPTDAPNYHAQSEDGKTQTLKKDVGVITAK